MQNSSRPKVQRCWLHPACTQASLGQATTSTFEGINLTGGLQGEAGHCGWPAARRDHFAKHAPRLVLLGPTA